MGSQLEHLCSTTLQDANLTWMLTGLRTVVETVCSSGEQVNSGEPEPFQTVTEPRIQDGVR